MTSCHSLLWLSWCSFRYMDYNNADKNVNLDIARFFAGMMVLSVHIGGRVGLPFDIGAKGVPLFFMLSGYLAYVTLSRGVSVKEYYYRRCKSILLPYYFCLFLRYLMNLVLAFKNDMLPEAFVGNGSCGPIFIRYVFFLQAMIPSEDWYTLNNINALWSMSSFALFYLIAPHLYRFVNSYNRAALTVAGLLFSTPIVNRALSYGGNEIFASKHPFTNLIYFYLGVLLFYVVTSSKYWLIVFALIYSIVTNAEGTYNVELLLFVLLFILIVLPPLIKEPKIVKSISYWRGGVYVLYLVHIMVLDCIDCYVFSNVCVKVLAMYCMSIGVSVIVYLISRKLERMVFACK